MKLPTLPRFGAAELLFSLKTFGAGILAMYIANRAGLPRPFWTLLTAYVVANPMAGAVRSKALYRFLGTLLGSSAAVLLVPTLSNAPELLTLALALWTGLCLFVSLLDRTPRAYIFLLAGYTAALIGFPSVQAPLQMFDTAVARVEEIGLAILCATLVHSIVLPTSLAPNVLGLMDRTLNDARRWLHDLLQPGPRQGAQSTQDPQALGADRRLLAADITQLRLLSTHVPFDTTHLRWTANAIRAMQDRVAALTPTLSSVEDRLAALEQAQGGALADDTTQLLAQIGNWLAAPTATQSAELPALLDAIRAIGEQPGLQAWERALRVGLAAGLEELVQGWRACAVLRRDIDAGLSGAAMPHHPASSNQVLHRDYGMALLSALAAVLAICLCSAFWIATGWSSGSAAAMMAAVFCSFFASMDDPVPAIHGFLKFTLWSMPISIVYVLVLLPLVHDFGMLVLVCAPLFLVAGCYMARPATMGSALALLFGVAGTLALHDTSSVDLAVFFNSMLGQIAGIVVAARVTRLVRSVGAEWSARRIQRAIWRELGELAGARGAPTSAAYSVRMLDRIGLLAPRVALASANDPNLVTNDALRDLRVGIDIAGLQRSRAQLPTQAVSGVLAGIAGFFRQRGAGRSGTWPTTLLADIDHSLAAALAAPTRSDSRGDWRAAVTALVGLRRNIFPHAPAALTSEGIST
ncbi:FUSC family protein [Rhodoferax sp.]|uniref:FUSC family protein n=1 Tax=Rhodoferax sp. TaxID=50421 RepID=UPI00374CCCEA